MSHPTGSYNRETLNILDNMKIQIGFNSSKSILNNTKIRLILQDKTQEDCTNILKYLSIK